MKKRMAWLLLVLLLTLPAQAAADIPWEPFDSFRDEHASACEYGYNNYIAAQQIEVWTNPEDDTPVFTVGEGEDVYTYCEYRDGRGILWGMVATREYGDIGWLPLGLTVNTDGTPVNGGPVDKLYGDEEPEPDDSTESVVWPWALGAVVLVVAAAAVVLVLVFRKKRK